MKKTIRCPECKKITEYSSANEYRPFCSKRCRLIDLGEWIEGKYKIETEKNDQVSEFQRNESYTKH